MALGFYWHWASLVIFHRLLGSLSEAGLDDNEKLVVEHLPQSPRKRREKNTEDRLAAEICVPLCVKYHSSW